MATTNPPDNWDMVTGTWGTDVDEYQFAASGNVAGLSTIEFKSGSGTAEIRSRKYMPLVGVDCYQHRFYLRGDSVAAGNTVRARVEYYNAAKAVLGSDDAINGVLPGINTWFDIRDVFTAPNTARWARFFIKKDENTSWTLYLDYANMWRHPWAFRAYRSSTQALAAATWEQIHFSHEDYDYGLGFDLANDYFVAPNKGVYHFDFHVRVDSVDSGAEITAGFGVNTTTSVTHKTFWDNNGDAGAQQMGIHGSADLLLDRNDYVSVMLYSTTAETTSSGSAEVWFSGHQVGGY
jgi:hypothetical protein